MTVDDLDDMAELLADPAVMAYYPSVKSRVEASRWIDWNLANYERDGYGLWVIESLEGEFLGDCGLTWQEVNGTPALEVGYHVRSVMQGRGFATEAASACRDFARDQTEEMQLVAIIHPENIASRRVAEKIGMYRLDDERGGVLTRHVMGMSLAPETIDGSAR